MLTILIVLGVILFVALLTLIFFAFFKGKPYTVFLIALLLPIVMIGFPSITSLKVDKQGVIFETIYRAATTCDTKENKDALEAAVEELEKKEGKQKLDPETYLMLNEAKLFLGKEEQITVVEDTKTKLKTTEQRKEYEDIKTAAEIQRSIEKTPIKTKQDSIDVRQKLKIVETLQIDPAVRESIKKKGMNKIDAQNSRFLVDPMK